MLEGADMMRSISACVAGLSAGGTSFVWPTFAFWTLVKPTTPIAASARIPRTITSVRRGFVRIAPSLDERIGLALAEVPVFEPHPPQ